MAYYPQSQITTNLYTNGGEFFYLTTKLPYSGYYYKLSTGKFYTGRTPQDLPSAELVQNPSWATPNQGNSLDNSPAIFSYSSNESTQYSSYPSDFFYQEYPKYAPVSRILPYYSPMSPTQQDYQVGEFRRYFCKKTNEIVYLEISETLFNLLLEKSPTIQWSLYFPFYLDWQLIGNKEQVAKINKNNTDLTSFKLKLPSLDQYLEFNWTKYYQQFGTAASGSYINGVNQGYVLDNRDGRSTRVFDSQNDSGSIRRNNSISR